MRSSDDLHGPPTSLTARSVNPAEAPPDQLAYTRFDKSSWRERSLPIKVTASQELTPEDPQTNSSAHSFCGGSADFSGAGVVVLAGVAVAGAIGAGTAVVVVGGG